MEGGMRRRDSQEEIDTLFKSKRIYIATVRRDGNQSKAVPVWFTVTQDHVILIETRPTTWLAKRVRRGSPVIVWIGSRNGPALIANAQMTGDQDLTKRVVDDYPRKYLLARFGFHRPRQARFEAGQILAIKITLIRRLAKGFVSEPGSRAPSLSNAEPLLSNAEPLSDRPYSLRQGIARAHIANLLSTSRFVLAVIWVVAFVSGNRHPEILGSIALAAAVSDFADGRIARLMGHDTSVGRWLDALADIAFILTALSCEALAGAIPIYLPVLIACSFLQYAIDSVVISGSSTPVNSRLGHWGGITNFALVLVLAWAPPPLLLARLVRQASPLLAMFYIAAIFERALNYCPLRVIRRDKGNGGDRVGPCNV
jgi:phosphatidylglycerophosphate synthase